MSDAQPQETGPKPLLDYRPRARLSWVGRHRRIFIILAACIAIAIALSWQWTPFRQRLLWQYHFRRAAGFRMPGKPVNLFSEDANEVARVLTDPDYQRYAPMGGGNQPRNFATYTPLAYRQLLKIDPRLGSAGKPDSPVAFMGTLHRPDGTARFVLVTGFTGDTTNIVRSVEVLVLPSPGWSDAVPTAVGNPIVHWYSVPGAPPTVTRLHSGLGDPHDPSHVVFEFEMSQGMRISGVPRAILGTGTIDAFLQNDDSVLFKLSSVTYHDQYTRIGATTVIPGDFAVRQAQAAQWSWRSPTTAPSSPATIQKAR